MPRQNTSQINTRAFQMEWAPHELPWPNLHRQHCWNGNSRCTHRIQRPPAPNSQFQSRLSTANPKRNIGQHCTGTRTRANSKSHHIATSLHPIPPGSSTEETLWTIRKLATDPWPITPTKWVGQWRYPLRIRVTFIPDPRRCYCTHCKTRQIRCNAKARPKRRLPENPS